MSQTASSVTQRYPHSKPAESITETPRPEAPAPEPVAQEPIHHGFWLVMLLWFVIFLGLMLTIWVDVGMGFFTHRQ